VRFVTSNASNHYFRAEKWPISRKVLILVSRDARLLEEMV
jgi:hypothetical protein